MLILLIPLLTGCLNLESLCHFFKVPFVTAHLIITYMYSSYSETRGADLLNVFHITLFYMLETLPIKFFFKYSSLTNVAIWKVDIPSQNDPWKEIFGERFKEIVLFMRNHLKKC